MFVAAMSRDSRTQLSHFSDIDGRLRHLFPGGQRLMQPPVKDPRTGLTLFAWLRLDNAEELTAELGADVHHLVAAGDQEPDPRFGRDAAIVLAAYARWGSDCVDRLEGDFVFVILDSRDDSAFAARDALGIRPLYIAVTPEIFVASPSAAPFDLFAGIDTSIRSEWLIDFIAGMSADWRETPFAGVRRLPPGHWLHVTRHAVVEHRYHEFDAESSWEDTRDPRWLEAYRNALIRAVSVRTEPAGLIGVETSGGIDSSTILGVMSHTHPDRIVDIHTFGFVTYSDEPEYILETSIAHGISYNHLLTRAAAGLDDLRLAWQVIGYPAEHGTVTRHIPFYDLAGKLGVATMHSGHGGDNGVTYNGTLALEELRTRRRWGQLMRDLPGPAYQRPARLGKRMLRGRDGMALSPGRISSDVAKSPLKLAALVERNLAEREKIRTLGEDGHTRVNDYILKDRLSALAAARTSDCSLVAASFGVDYRWPLLDRRLVQQYLSTPSIWKYGEGFSRYLHRRAIAGIVPEKVAWKPRKAMGSPLRPKLRQTPSVSAADHSKEGAAATIFLDRMHPKVRVLLDTSEVKSLLGADQLPGQPRSAVMAMVSLDRAALVSEWLHWRQPKLGR